MSELNEKQSELMAKLGISPLAPKSQIQKILSEYELEIAKLNDPRVTPFIPKFINREEQVVKKVMGNNWQAKEKYVSIIG